MRFVTEETLRAAVGDVQIDPDQFGQVLDDARCIHCIVIEEPWLTETRLRSCAESKGLDPDRVNAALAVLVNAGQLFSVSLTEKQIPAPEEDLVEEPQSAEKPPVEEPEAGEVSPA